MELTANVTQLMEAERNTRLNTCGVERGIHRDLPFVRFLGVHVFCHKEMKRGYGIYIIYTIPEKMSADKEVQHLECSPPLTSSHG